MDVDFNLLGTLLTFTQSGSIAETARRIGRTEGAVSVRLHQLENQLGLKLFERVGRRLVLTDAGAAVAGDANDLGGLTSRLAETIASFTGAVRGRLRVGALPTVASYLLAPAIHRVTEAADLRVELVLDLNRVLLQHLRQGVIDAVVTLGTPPESRLEVERLGHVRAVLAQRAEIVTSTRPVSVAQLRRLRLIGYGVVEDSFFAEVAKFIADNDLNDQVRTIVSHIPTIKELVAAGVGAAVLPDYTVREPSLATRRVAGLTGKYPVWIATRAGARDIPLIRSFCGAVRESICP